MKLIDTAGGEIFFFRLEEVVVMELIFSHRLNQPKSLYIHFPICRHVCSYCDFTVISQHEAQSRFQTKSVELWIDSLERHLSTWKNQFEDGKPLETLYFGGGTPSLMSCDEWSQTLEVVNRHFELSNEAEVTIEANPESVTEKLMRHLVSLGVNRVSLGVQTTHSDLLKRLERLSTVEKISDATQLAKALFKNINIDLMIGIPDQSMDQLLEDLEFIKQLGPQHISVYVLTLQPNHIWNQSSFMKNRLGTPEIVEKYFFEVIRQLKSMGFHHYEVSNFALYGFESRHNKNYWNPDSSYLGVGPGAHSYVAGVNGQKYRTANLKTLEDFFKSVSGIEEIETLTSEQTALERLYLTLRTRVPFVPDPIDQQRLLPRLNVLEKEGLIENQARGYLLTDRGWLLMESVAAHLL